MSKRTEPPKKGDKITFDKIDKIAGKISATNEKRKIINELDETLSASFNDVEKNILGIGKAQSKELYALADLEVLAPEDKNIEK